jgi:hypothetical protein
MRRCGGKALALRHQGELRLWVSIVLPLLSGRRRWCRRLLCLQESLTVAPSIGSRTPIMANTSIDVDKHKAEFSKRGLSLAEWFVLSIPGQWPVPKEELPRVAASQSEGDPRGNVRGRDCQTAYQELVKKGLIRVIRDTDLSKLHEVVARLGCGEPVYGFPQVGDVDFTGAGAVMFRGLSHELYGKYFFSEAMVEPDDEGRTVYTARKTRADQIVAESRNQHAYEVGVVRRIDKWCIYWWKVFQSGWEIELINSSHRR